MFLNQIKSPALCSRDFVYVNSIIFLVTYTARLLTKIKVIERGKVVCSVLRHLNFKNRRNELQ